MKLKYAVFCFKEQFPDIVEKGRIEHGQFKTSRGDTVGLFLIKGPMAEVLTVMVSDGYGWEEMGFHSPAWEHVSVYKPSSIPSWPEMCFIKDLFFEAEDCVLQFHPPKSQYVNCHEYCLHLWRVIGFEFPMPPSVTVGPSPEAAK